MTLLTSLTLCSTITAKAAEIPEEVKFNGTVYTMTEQAARDILEGWKSDKAAKEEYKRALEEFNGRWGVFRGNMEAQINEIKAAHQKEREEYNKQLRSAKRPGLGMFVRAGYGTAGEAEAVIGIGLVWKMF